MINIQNFDNNDWFKLWLARYLHPVDHHLARIKKIDILSGDELDFKDIKFPVKIRDIHKIINDCFKINDKQMIQMPKQGEYPRFKSYERKINS